MTEKDGENGGILDRIRETVSNALGGDSGASTGSDAVADAPTDVARAADNSLDSPYRGSGGSSVGRQFGATEGGLSDILPGGPGVGTQEDDTLTDRLNSHA